MPRLKRVLLPFCLVAFLGSSTGCYGQFALTKKLHDWNGSLGDKWVESLVFWGFLIVPIYAVSTFGDAVVFNVIEFWTGNNPMSEVSLPKPQPIGQNGVQWQHQGRTYQVRRLAEDRFELHVDGTFAAEATTDGKGGLILLDHTHQRTRHLPKNEMMGLRHHLAPQ